MSDLFVSDKAEDRKRELDAAKCVPVVWSKRSLGPEGAFVENEATRARRALLPAK